MERVYGAIQSRVGQVRAAMTQAALRRDRDPSGVALMAVVKTRSPEEIREVLAAGVTLLGENRVQEGAAHLEALGPGPRRSFRLHFIGRLQTNKARKAMDMFDSIDGVDSLHLAQLLSRLAQDAGLARDLLLEVNLGEESQKGGVAPSAAEALAEAVHGLPGLSLTGLMGVCPYAQDAEASRPYYRDLHHLFDRLRRGHPQPGTFRWLSMGMSHDFHVAVEEGATLVRVGEALFGPRRPA